MKYNDFSFGTHSETSWYFGSMIALFSIMYEKSGRIIHLIFCVTKVERSCRMVKEMEGEEYVYYCRTWKSYTSV